MARAALPGRRKLTRDELEMILDAHARLVRGEPGGKRASLPFVDFTGFDLSGRDLTEAEFAGSVFDGAKRLAAWNSAYRDMWQLDEAFLRNSPTEGEVLDRLRSELGGIEQLSVQADRRVDRGGVVARTREGEIDATVEAQLERAREVVAAELERDAG